MQKIKRTALLLLAALMLLSAFNGCSAKEKQEQRVIGTCAGYDVLYEELRYVTLTYKDMFAATYGENIWDTPESAEKYRAELEETVWDMMLNNYAVLYTCAQYMIQHDMESRVIEDAVDAQIEEMIDQYGGKNEFRDALEELHMTENFARFCLRVAQLENELKYILTDDLGIIENDLEDFRAWLEDDNCVYVQHIFIRNDAGDDIEANRATAEDIRQQLLNGVSISKLVGSAVNEDLQNTAPYFLVRDVYIESLESAAFSLDYVGDISDVVETEDGYYVLVRMEYSEETLNSQQSDLLTSYQWARLEAMADENRNKIAIELNEYGKELDLLTIE